MQGGVFDRQLPGGRSSADIEVGTERITATLADGSTRSIPTRQCRLELGGESGRMWFVRDRERELTVYSEDSRMLPALREVRALADQVQALHARARAERTRARYLWVFGIALVLLLSVGAYFGLLSAARAGVAALPPAVDAKLGELAIARMDLGGPQLQDPAVVQPVRKIVARLAPHARAEAFTFRVRVVQAEPENAFALPGGPIVVYTGLLEAAAGPEAVAGVLAHEMAHVTRRHGLLRIAHTVGLTAALQLLLGDVAGLSGLLLQLAQEGALTHHDRAQEAEADADAVATLHRAGIDPSALSDFFGTLQAEQEAAGGPTLPPWLSTHPELPARRAAIRALAAQLGTTTDRPLDVDWAALQAALAKHSTVVAADRDAPDLNAGAPAGDDTAPRADGD